MNNFMFQQPNEEKQEDITRYCLVDKKDSEDDTGNPVLENPKKESDILAYKVRKINGDYKFMVRINADRKLYNPLSIYGTEKSYKLLDNITRSSLQYREVNCTVFDFYLRFLSTKNTAWLNKAEREV